MGGDSAICLDWEFTSSPNEARTVVLVGKTGNGKSSTGNTLLGRKAFYSKTSSGSVTATCELQRTRLENRSLLNVIDTPGLFDFSGGEDQVGKEIVKCIDMANNGIHAVLFVLSVRSRFSREEKAAIESMIEIFGEKITNYMILIFTGGDDLEENEETLDDYLGRDCPDPLKEIIEKCGHRCILFDNRTKDPNKRLEQVEKLIALVDEVVKYNGKKPYTNKLFQLQKEAQKLRVQEAAEGSSKFQEQIKRYEKQIKKMADMIESKLREANEKLVKQLAKEQKARLKAEKNAKAYRDHLNEGFRKMEEELHNVERQINDKIGATKSGCIIM